MAYQDLINKVRQWDNTVAKWLIRHFYVTFFQGILVVIFVFWFMNTYQVMFHAEDVQHQTYSPQIIEKILSSQSISLTLIVFLMLLNSFWMLFIFSGIQRMQAFLKEMNYSLFKIRDRQNPNRNN